MRCSRCGNDNPADNRFCGMCGATLLAPVVPPATAIPETQTQRAASAGTAIPSVASPSPVVTAPPPPQEKPRPQEVPRPSAPAVHEPSISGPSFLGLNDPPPRTRATLHVDPHHAGSSGNLDYLLDDEEQPKRGGLGKALFVVALLAIVVGFGYLRFRNNGFKWSNSDNKPTASDNKPAPTEQPAAEPNANTPASSTPSITPDQTPAATQPAAKAPQPAPANPTADANPPSATPTNPAPSKGDDSKAAAKDTSADNPDDSAGDDNSEPATAPTKPAKAETPKPVRTKPSAAKPSPVAKPARATDTVAEAQKYLYGKGAPQNCDRGLQLLKPEANKADPKAMIEMGALYSAGLCTPRDLPTAYRWFAQALRKDPENAAVQTDLQKLWGEMTQPERQLAIKLSQ
jgi:zinc-ribbon domain